MYGKKRETKIQEIQDFLFVTYTIIQSITSSEMLVRSAPWTVQLYGILTQRIYINIYIKNIKMNEVENKK